MSRLQRSQPVSMRETPGADVVITRVESGGLAESVTITNRGQLDQPLTGWDLASLHGVEVYAFPEGTVLPARGQLTVLSGDVAQSPGPRRFLWERANTLNNRSDTVLLFDNQGHEVSRFTYPRPTIREERKPKRKILVRELDGYHLRDWDDLIPPGKD